MTYFVLILNLAISSAFPVTYPTRNECRLALADAPLVDQSVRGDCYEVDLP
jgi:hypothetical protein